jgi:hypothetical protein
MIAPFTEDSKKAVDRKGSVPFADKVLRTISTKGTLCASRTRLRSHAHAAEKRVSGKKILL